MQLYDINVATKPLKSKDLSEQSVITLIEEMNETYRDKKKNAEMISQKIQSENGVANAVRLIKMVMESEQS